MNFKGAERGFMRQFQVASNVTFIVVECALRDAEKRKIDTYITRVLNERFKPNKESKNAKN